MKKLTTKQQATYIHTVITQLTTNYTRGPTLLPTTCCRHPIFINTSSNQIINFFNHHIIYNIQ